MLSPTISAFQCMSPYRLCRRPKWDPRSRNPSPTTHEVQGFSTHDVSHVESTGNPLDIHVDPVGLLVLFSKSHGDSARPSDVMISVGITGYQLISPHIHKQSVNMITMTT